MSHLTMWWFSLFAPLTTRSWRLLLEEIEMSKRYIDTGLFDDDWFMDLSKDSKILYMYLITKCSHAGLIKINERLCKVQTGITDLKGALKGLKSRLIEAQEGLLFMPKFLFFQYPKFPQSTVFQQKAALEELTKYGLFKDGKLAPQEGLKSPYVDVSVDVNDITDVKKVFIYNKVYDNFLKETENTTYLNFVKFIFGNNITNKPFDNIIKLEGQLSPKSFESLLSKYPKEKIKQVVEDMAGKDISKYNISSFTMTLNKWLRK